MKRETKLYSQLLALILTIIMLGSVILKNISIIASAEDISEFTVNLDIYGDGGTVIFKDQSSGDVISEWIHSGKAIFQNKLDDEATYTVTVEGITGYSYYEENVSVAGMISKEITMSQISQIAVTGTVEDGNGNVEGASVEGDSQECTTIIADTTAPIIGEITKGPDSKWHNGSVEISIPVTYEKEESDVDRVVYSTEYATYQEAVGNAALDKANLINGNYIITVPNNEFNGTYYIWAVDDAGNVSLNGSSIEVKIDKAAPQNMTLTYVKETEKGFIKEVMNALTLGYFFKDTTCINLTAADSRSANGIELDSGISHYEYQLVADEDVNDNIELTSDDIKEDKWVLIDKHSESVEVYIPYEEFVGKVYVRAWDMAGNCTVAVTDIDGNTGTTGTTIIMDRETSLEAPSINLNGYTIDNWTSSDVIITLSGAETLSGVDYYQYRIEYEDSGRAPLDWTEMTESSQELNHTWTGTTINNQITIRQDENATYYFRAMSNTGVESAETEGVAIMVDKTLPNIGVITKSPDSTDRSGWNNSIVEISVPAIDEGSGIAKVVYSTEHSTYEEASQNFSLGEVNVVNSQYIITTPEDEYNGIYYIWGIDNVGLISTDGASMEVKIDTTKPHDLTLKYSKEENRGFIKEVMNVFTFGYFFKDTIGINITAKDMRISDNKSELVSGLSHYEYQLVADEDVHDNIEATVDDMKEDRWVLVNKQSESVEVDIPYKEFAGKVYVRVWDIAGNCAVAVTDINTDTGIIGTTVVMDRETSEEAPLINLNGYTNGTWTNSNVVITLSGAETLSGVDYYEYRIDYADTSIASVNWCAMPDSDTLLPHIEKSTKINNKITINQDVNATYSFRTVSNTGVISDKISSIAVKVQKTLPENATVDIAGPNGRNNWYVSRFPTIEITKPTVSPYAATVTTYYKLWNTTKGETEGMTTAVVFNGNNQPTIKSDGIYKLMIWTSDEANNQCSTNKIIEKEIKVDITAPTQLAMDTDNVSIIAKVANSTAFNLFYNEAIKITLSANCGVSGLKSLECQKVKSVIDYNAVTGKWVDYDSATGIVVEPNEKFVIYFRAEDTAGNVTIINSDGVVVDNQSPVGETLAPELTITPGQANSGGYYNGDVRVDITTVDPKYSLSHSDTANGVYSGLASVTYRILADNIVTREQTVLFPSASYPYTTDSDGLVQTWSGSIVIDSAVNNSNNVVVEVTSVDNAGNSRTTRTADLGIKIDITVPSIDISYNNNTTDTASLECFNADRVATIIVTERNFNASDVVINITNRNGSIPSVSSWTKCSGSGNGDGTTYTTTITFRADGEYTFDISYKDLADNVCAGANYASGTVAPTKFIIDRTKPQITVTYDNDDVNQEKYFKEYRTATISIIEHNFDAGRITYRRTSTKAGKPITEPEVSDWTSSGDVHTATIQYNAEGDYTFDIEMEDMAGNKNDKVNYGSSAASKDFVIDTDIAKPSIIGVENGKSYKGDVIPIISFNDINYENYEVTLLRTRKEEKNIDVASQFITGIITSATGGSGANDTFEKIQDNDGIYTLNVKLIDKAGNEESEEVIFSVNRFGSVYVFNDYLISLQDEYVQGVKDKIIITEYNPDKLLEDSLELEITLDGTPINDVQYDVTPVINDTVKTGESGWFQYKYSLDAANFDKNGIYKITVSSEDAAGNTPENTNYDDLGILFRVDTTKPELINVVGLETNSINADTVHVIFEAFDAIGLKEITVYVNNSVIETYKTFEDMINFTGSFEIGEGMSQKVRIVVEDMAGNVTDTEDDGFTTEFKFARIVTISTNILIRWYADKLLFRGSIICTIILAVTITFLVFLKKGKENKGNDGQKI